MDEEQTQNGAEDDHTGDGDNVEVQEGITHHAGNDADRGGEYVRYGFCSNQDVSAGGKIPKNAAVIIRCLTADYTDFLQIVAKAARMTGSWSSNTVRRSRRTFPSEIRLITGGV